MGVLNVWPAAWPARFALAGSIALHGAAIAAVSSFAPASLPATTAAERAASETAVDVVIDDVEVAPTAPTNAVARCAPATRQAPAPRRAPPAPTRAPSAPPLAAPRELAPDVALAPDVPPEEERELPRAVSPAGPATGDAATRAAPGASGEGDDGLGVYARVVQEKLGRAAAAPDVAARIARRASVIVEIVVERSGAVTDARVAAGDADPEVRALALHIVRGAAPFPPPPPTMRDHGIVFRLPLRFALR